MRHLDSLLRLHTDDVETIFRICMDLKTKWSQGARPRMLDGRVLTQLYEKPSLRTRISFEAAVAHLGGSSLFLSAADAGLNGRETIADVARVLGSYSDWIVIRTFSHKLIEAFVKYADCSVINGLSDAGHPCQALTDLFTAQEHFGELQGRTFTFVGDGNNVARSLAVATSLLGMSFILCAPLGYEFSADFLGRIKKHAPHANITITADPFAAVARADVVYTDVWTSMGQEAEQEKRKLVFAPYQVNAKLMHAAPKTARFMHCLPARRGMEVTDEVLDGDQSVVFPQAENRMHIAKAIMVWLLGSDPVV